MDFLSDKRSRVQYQTYCTVHSHLLTHPHTHTHANVASHVLLKNFLMAPVRIKRCLFSQLAAVMTGSHDGSTRHSANRLSILNAALLEIFQRIFF